jgi:HD-like signal output (HDOD) protein
MSVDIDQAVNILKQALDSGSVDVPVLPETANRVISLTQDVDSDASQLAAVIQSDPTLGGHVMRIANSAAYTPNSNLVSIQQAVARLGMVEISNIAFSISLNSKIFKAPGYEKEIAEIWQHALATALWSKEVARSMRSNVEAAFLCGLLHSIGKPVILQTIADKAVGQSPIAKEKLDVLYKQYESAYSQVVSKEWELPKIVAEAIIYYKNFSQISGDQELAATIAFGHELANLLLYPELIDKESIVNSPALDIINLYPDEVEAIIDKSATIKSGMETLSQ